MPWKIYSNKYWEKKIVNSIYFMYCPQNFYQLYTSHQAKKKLVYSLSSMQAKIFTGIIWLSTYICSSGSCNIAKTVTCPKGDVGDILKEPALSLLTFKVFTVQCIIFCYFFLPRYIKQGLLIFSSNLFGLSELFFSVVVLFAKLASLYF